MLRLEGVVSPGALIPCDRYKLASGRLRSLSSILGVRGLAFAYRQEAEVKFLNVHSRPPRTAILRRHERKTTNSRFIACDILCPELQTS